MQNTEDYQSNPFRVANGKESAEKLAAYQQADNALGVEFFSRNTGNMPYEAQAVFDAVRKNEIDEAMRHGELKGLLDELRSDPERYRESFQRINQMVDGYLGDNEIDRELDTKFPDALHRAAENYENAMQQTQNEQQRKSGIGM